MRTFLEAFEARRMLSSESAHLSHLGTLIVSGTENGDGILVRRLNDGRIQAIVNDLIQFFDRADVRRIAIYGLDGSDRLENRTTIRSTILGGAGDDALFPGHGSDAVDGEQGIDRVDYSGRDEALRFGAILSLADNTVNANASPSTGGGEFDVFERVEAIRGTDVGDTIDLGGANISLFGGGGNDVFQEYGSVENPAVYHASLFGEEGNDRFTFFTTGTLSIDAGDGDDLIFPESARPFVLDGGSGSDTIDLQNFGQDSVDLNDYPSVENAINLENVIPFRLIGTPAPNLLMLKDSEVQKASITVEGQAGDDTIIGTTGNDSLDGGEGNDVIRGGDGDDTIIGDAGRDKLYGEAGDDLLLGRGGSKDRLDGGDGDDTASADAGPDVFDLIFNVESVN